MRRVIMLWIIWTKNDEMRFVIEKKGFLLIIILLHNTLIMFYLETFMLAFLPVAWNEFAIQRYLKKPNTIYI